MKLSLISYVCYRLARALLRALVFLTLSSFVYISFHFFSFLFFLSFLHSGAAWTRWYAMVGALPNGMWLIVYTYISDAQYGLDGYMHIHTYTYIMHCRWDGDLHSLSQSDNSSNLCFSECCSWIHFEGDVLLVVVRIAVVLFLSNRWHGLSL